MNTQLRRRALLLSYFTVGYNLVECVVAIVAGLMARSPALIGFAVDSLVESLSGGVIIWRFRQRGRISEEEDERLEARAVRLVAYTFFVLGAYVLYESAQHLYSREAPGPSLLGLAVAAVSLIVMPVLSYAKYRTGMALGSSSLVADSRETLACAWLSAALLVGLGLNYLYGLWWADPAAGLVIVVFLLAEGYSTLKEGDLCGPDLEEDESES